MGQVQSQPLFVGPKDFREVVSDIFGAYLGGQVSKEETDKKAMRSARAAGWYMTKDGWEQLGPDVRDKINIRQAEKQPDGRFVVRDVDVFYPNAVKGQIFSPENVRSAIGNTNRAIENGGQAPSVAKEHPSPLGQAMGNPALSYGRALNWRESGRGEGWARCDLVDVQPEVVSDWKKGHYTGLSAGLVKDQQNLNLRFGHVALLGVESQALSLLPTTEIYSADGQICFSAEKAPIVKGLETMAKLSKDQIANARQSYQAMDSALASFEAGEPGADAKLQEAWEATHSSPVAGMFESEEEEEAPRSVQEILAADEHAAEEGEEFEADDEDEDEEFMTQAPSEVTELPAPPKETSNDMIDNDITVAVTKEFSAMQAQLDAQSSAISEGLSVISALRGKLARDEFSAYCADLQAKGHQFSAESAVAMFKSVAASQEGLDALKAMLAGSPIKENLVEMGKTFSAEDSQPLAFTGKLTEAEGVDMQKLLHKHCPGVNFSAEDVQIGAAISI